MDNPQQLPSGTSTHSNSAEATLGTKKQADSAVGLTVEQDLHQIFFHLTSDGMILSDQEGRILDVNAEAARQFGYRREELIGEALEKLLPQRFWDAHKIDRAQYQAAPAARPMNRGQETVGLHRNGSEFPVDISLTTIHRQDATLFYAAVRDVRGRVEMQQLKSHLNLERTISILSAKFINLPSNQVDAEINSGLEVLVDALGTDRATVAQVDPASTDICVTHVFARPGIAYFPERVASDFLPWLAQRVKNGEITKAEKPEDLPSEAQHERSYMESAGEKSTLIVPLRISGKVIGGMSTDTFREYRQWDDAVVWCVQHVADIFANALSRKKSDELLQNALAQIHELKDKVEKENVWLREEIKLENPHEGVIGNSAAIREVLKKVEQVAVTDSAVLILGETGTGKELIARAIHNLSRRRDRLIVKVDCAALPPTLIESELFGREKGAYTGALSRQIGRFETADGSTLFLDEIGELGVEVQAKLLRIVQDGQFERLGSSKTTQVNVRIIAATHRNLAELVKNGTFREDLFYRLNVFPILVPPLHERLEDIPLLVTAFIREFEKKLGKKIRTVPSKIIDELKRYPWPGNIRELRNVIERAVIITTGERLNLQMPKTSDGVNAHSLRQAEAELIRTTLEKTGWRVKGPNGAALILGVNPSTLYTMMRRLHIPTRHEKDGMQS